MDDVKHELCDEFNKVFQHFMNKMEWGWELAALNAFRDAILCEENGNHGGAMVYAGEANGYLVALADGYPYNEIIERRQERDRDLEGTSIYIERP